MSISLSNLSRLNYIKAMAASEKNAVNLTGVPETALLTLHNRVSEAMRPDGILRDPEAIRIYNSLQYNFEHTFGKSTGANASRSLAFDKIVGPWINQHPDGLVVCLGEGLETQRCRLDNGKIRWLTIDLPESIAIREKFLKPNDRFQHLAKSALDFTWIDNIQHEKSLFVCIQGLLMYFDPSDVRALLTAIATRLPQAELIFDYAPEWLSVRTQRPRGMYLTRHYRIPPMPWGVNRNRVKQTLRTWIPSIKTIELFSYDFFTRGLPSVGFSILKRTPIVRNKLMGIVRIRF